MGESSASASLRLAKVLGYAVVMICKIVLSGKLVRLSQMKEPLTNKGRKSCSVFLAGWVKGFGTADLSRT